MGLRQAIDKRATLRGSYLALLGAMVLAIFVQPIVLHTGVIAYVVREVLYLFVLFSTLASAVSDRRHFNVMACVAIVAEMIVFLSYLPGVPTDIHHLGQGMRVVFLFWAAGVILTDVLRAGKDVTTDKILGAVCVYLLMALAFGLIYGMAYAIDPTSFLFVDIVDPGTPSPHDSDDIFLYFSVVTLSTLGYGDVTPTAPFVRSLAMSQTIVGQFFIAIVVARLVALHVMQDS